MLGEGGILKPPGKQWSGIDERGFVFRGKGKGPKGLEF